MDAKLIEVMIVMVLTLLVFWLLTRLCFRICKVLITKGPGFMKYLIILCGIIGLIWIYYNPNGAKLLYEITKSRLLGGVSSSNAENYLNTEEVDLELEIVLNEI